MIEAERFFSSKAFEAWKKGREAETKIQVSQIDRLNGIIRAIDALIKTISKRPTL